MQAVAGDLDTARRAPGVVVAEDSTARAWTMIVGPFGQVQHLEVKSNVGGDVPVYWDPNQGAPMIPKRYRDQGWCFYEEICRGLYDETGTSKDKGLVHLAMWEKMRDALSKGRRPVLGTLNTDLYYHPEVLRRRKLDRPDGMVPVTLEELMGDLADGLKPVKENSNRGKR
jgi:hypothetical protein